MFWCAKPFFGAQNGGCAPRNQHVIIVQPSECERLLGLGSVYTHVLFITKLHDNIFP